MRHERVYVVEGEGPFPADMLRYDDSSPTTEQDAELARAAREGLSRRRVARDRRSPTGRRTCPPRAQARSPRAFETIGIHLNIALGLSNEVGPPYPDPHPL